MAKKSRIATAKRYVMYVVRYVFEIGGGDLMRGYILLKNQIAGIKTLPSGHLAKEARFTTPF